MRFTIMATGSTHKLSNHLVAGNLGIGGQSSIGNAKYTVIASRLEADPNLVQHKARYGALLFGGGGQTDPGSSGACGPAASGFTLSAERTCARRRVRHAQPGADVRVIGLTTADASAWGACH
jgi:hypothetical protein